MTRTGGCQCGAVRFRAESIGDTPGICHCRMCQKASGNFFMALVAVPKSDLTWSRGKPAIFESSEGIERGFCRDCGTPLFFHDRSAAHVSLTIGSFDHPEDIPIVAEYAMERRAPQLDSLGKIEKLYMADEKEYIAERNRTNRQHPDDDTENWPV